MAISKERAEKIAFIVLCGTVDPDLTREEFRAGFMSFVEEDTDMRLKLEADGITSEEFEEFLDIFYEKFSKK